MDNNELMNTRVLLSLEHLKEISSLVDEIALLAPPQTYLHDLIESTLRSIAMLQYNLDIADKVTEKIKV